MNRTTIGWIAATVTAAGLVTAACTQLSGPARPTGYAFTLVARDSVTADTTVDGVHYPVDTVVTDTVWFHWPASSLPVRIWVQDDSLDLPAHIEAGIGLWKKILLYGEYDAVEVADSANADVLVFSSAPPPSPAPAFVRMHEFAPDCEGATDVKVSAPDHKRVVLPIRIYIDAKYSAALPTTQACLALTAAHELGHSMGLFQHSPNATDLMYAFPTVAGPSAVDASTVLFLYHFRGDLVPSHG